MPKEKNIQNQKAVPNPDLRSLDKLVGTWEVSGGAQGTITYEWMEAGFFLVQHIELVHDDYLIKAIEYIGHEQKFGQPPSEEIKTRVFSFLDGMTLDYVYEMDGNNLTIWLGEKNSSGYMKGQISEDGNSFTGEWTYPDGGYSVTGKKIT